MLRRSWIVVLAVVPLLVSAVSHAAPAPIAFFASVGYGAGRGGGQGVPSQTYDSDGQLVVREDHYPSLGEGLKIDAGAEHPLVGAVTIRVVGGYSRMPPERVAFASEGDPDLAPWSETHYAHVFHGGALAVLAARTGTFRPYAGMGAGVYFASQSQTGDYNKYGDIVHVRIKSRVRPALGLIAVVGLAGRARGRFTPFAELALEQVSFRVRGLDVVESQSRGYPVAADVDPYTPGDQSTVTYDENSTTAPAPPVEQASSVSLAAGLRFAF